MDERDKLVCEIMQLAYLVQRHTNICVFIRYAGHVDALEIDLRKSVKEWQTEIMRSEISQIYRTYYEKGEPLRDLKTKRDILLKIVNEHAIPYDELNIEQYIVEEYTF